MTEWDRNWLAGYVAATQFYVLNAMDETDQDLRGGAKGGILNGQKPSDMASGWSSGWADACLDAFGC